MVFVKYSRSGNYCHLMGTSFVSFLSLVSIECILGELSSNVIDNKLNGVNQVRQQDASVEGDELGERLGARGESDTSIWPPPHNDPMDGSPWASFANTHWTPSFTDKAYTIENVIQKSQEAVDPGNVAVKETLMVIAIAVSLVIASVVGDVIIIIVIIRHCHANKENNKHVVALRELQEWMKRIIVEKIQSTYYEEIPYVTMENLKPNSFNKPEYQLPVDAKWEIPRERLKFGERLGEGNFGRVVKAKAYSIVEENVTTIVAVKMLKETHSDSDFLNLVQEMEILKMIGKHDNVINLLGCCTQGGSLLIIMPHAPYGNLRDFLRKHRLASDNGSPIELNLMDENKLVSFAHQIAKGMEHLASINVVHRDLAARNILVAEDYVMKIADFGLARDVYTDDYYRKTSDGKLPVKWMAPEAIFDREYTTKSDVWSFGILSWEIMTLGCTPYPSIPDIDVDQILRKGHRMEKPPHCSVEMYSIMKNCWSYQPDERPTFSDLVEELQHILTQLTDDVYSIENPIYMPVTPPSSLEPSDIDDQTHD